MRRAVSPGRRRRWLAMAMVSFSAVGLFSGPVPDHIAVYSGLEDVFAFSLEAPQEFAPGTVGRYRNVDTLVLGAIIRRTVEAVGESYHHWPQRMLFDALGTDDFVLETDASGHFVLSGYLYGTAEAWARLALLFLRGGVVDDQRLMPESFVDFVRTPGAAWPGANSAANSGSTPTNVSVCPRTPTACSAAAVRWRASCRPMMRSWFASATSTDGEPVRIRRAHGWRSSTHTWLAPFRQRLNESALMRSIR